MKRPISAIVLAGGESRRMGRPKWNLPFGRESMLERVVRVAGETAQPVIVVLAKGQSDPRLSASVIVVHDLQPERGPLEGLLAGLQAAPKEIEAVFVTVCDAPRLVPGFIDRMLELLGNHDAAVPWIDGRPHPLAAVYRRSILETVKRLLAEDSLRMTTLIDHIDARRVSADEIREIDPELASIENLNSPADYQAALLREGLA